MLKNNELRIGNLVEWYGKPYPIIQIKENNACIEDLSNDFDQLHWLPVLSPIPLTEEWLLKFDIIKRNFTEDMPEAFHKPDIDEDGDIWYSWVKGAFNLEIQTNGEIWFEVYSHYKHIKYVHQLQNLYWCLVGEELEIKL